MKIKIRFSLAIFGLLSIFLLLPACQKKVEETKKEVEKIKEEFKVEELTLDTELTGEEGIKNTIKAYNITLRRAHLADPYIRELRKYATDGETQRIFIETDVDTQKGIAMRSWQKELVFRNISVSEKNAYADTSEIWDYEYVDIKTKKVTELMKTIIYKLRYTLEREEGKWVVSKIREREESQLMVTIGATIVK